MGYTDEDVLSDKEIIGIIERMDGGETDKTDIKRLINSPNFWQAVACYIVEKELSESKHRNNMKKILKEKILKENPLFTMGDVKVWQNLAMMMVTERHLSKSSNDDK